jgi:glycosyltransferase involved in cell wall biosynthesis
VKFSLSVTPANAGAQEPVTGAAARDSWIPAFAGMTGAGLPDEERPLTPHLVLDLSRLLSRAERAVPTGIDRVELAYAEHAIATARQRLSFAGMLSWGRFGMLGTADAVALVEALGHVFRSDADAAGAMARAAALGRRLRVARFLRGGLGLGAALAPHRDDAVYLLVSHHHLDKPAIVERLKRRTGARFACMVHDLIPLEFPEYARPGHDVRHVVRMTTVARHADLVIVNSAATREAFQPFLARAHRAPPVVVAPLGIEPPHAAVPPAASSESPYFVCVGTIEPRKNHLLLLNLWRQLVAESGGAAPRLVLVGQRGWENENVVDMLERSPGIQGHVEERNDLSDPQVARLLAGARALLLPSFAEGYGLPVGEALAAGVPVLCSPLPALREVARDVAEFLDPLDGAAWRRAILDYAAPHSARRDAQLARIATWHAPTWAEHFAIVDDGLRAMARHAAVPAE